MEDNNLNINELIRIEQLPKIYQQLDQINLVVKEKVKNLDLIECTEENKQEAKKYRTYLNTIKNQLEDKRKEIKKKINEPYESFNSYYEEKVKSVLDDGISKLGNKIDAIEEEQIKQKTQVINDFFQEYRKFYHLESVIEDLTQVPIKINLTASEKSLKEQTQAFLIKLSQETQAIAKEPTYREEILLEYKRNGYDYATAVLEVKQKQEEIEKMKQASELAEQQFKEDSNAIQEINTLVSAPVEVEEEELIEIIFKVRATKSQLLELRNYLKSQEIDYE